MNHFYHIFTKTLRCQRFKLSFVDAKEEILTGLYMRDLMANLITIQHNNDALLHDLMMVSRVKKTKLHHFRKRFVVNIA